MKRRDFLRGVLSATVITTVPPLALAASIPVIYADGIHDDADGLQALFDGKPVRVDGKDVIVTEGRLCNGRFRVSRTVIVRSPRIGVSHCEFQKAVGPFTNTDLKPPVTVGGPEMAILLPVGSEGFFDNCMFRGVGVGSFNKPDVDLI